MDVVQNNKVIKALNWRYAVKEFDSNKKISDKDLHIILESGRLSPSSIGIEPWRFIVVTNPEIRTKMRAASYDQTKVTDASHIIVIARRTDSENLSSELIERTALAQNKNKEELDGLKQMVDGSISAKDEGAIRDGWIAAQTYIALGIMIQTAALLNIDTGPMEGFDQIQIDNILNLTKENLSAVTMLAVGYRGEDPYAMLHKTRRGSDEVIEFIT